MLRQLLIIVVLSLTLIACKTGKSTVDSGQIPDAEIVSLQDTKWILVELMGAPVDAAKLQKVPFLLLQSSGQRAVGTAGCNNFNGSYQLDESKLSIRFDKIASTMMACENMEVEAQFLTLIETVDNYSLNGPTLTLNRARMAPLARFVAVEE
jgi:heat shock protein HslJ